MTRNEVDFHMSNGGSQEQENLYERIKILENILDIDNGEAGKQWDDTQHVDGNLVSRIDKREEFLEQTIEQFSFTL